MTAQDTFTRRTRLNAAAHWAGGLLALSLLMSSAASAQVTNTNTGDVFSTIQAAIDDPNTLDGHTISIAPGAYEEQIVITKNGLVLQGSGNGADPNIDTIIESPVSLAYSFNSGANDNYPIVGVDGATGVELRDLRVDGLGRGNGNYRFIGIAFWNVDGTVSDCVVTNIKETPFSGTQHGNAIYAYNNGGGPYTLNISNTDVDNYQKNGFTMVGNGLTANLTNCTATGVGPSTTIAQNGIQISLGATGAISGCTTGGHIWTPATYAATGILLYEASGIVTIDDTTVYDNFPGIYCQDTNATLDGVTITNTIPEALDGMYAYNSTTSVLLAGDPTNPALAPRVRRIASAADAPAQLASGPTTRAPMTVQISNSSFSGNGTSPDSWGIGAFGSDLVSLTLTGSTVTGWDYGVLAFVDPNDTFYVGPVALTATGNQILGNNSYGCFNNDPNGTLVTAENNWWGDASGPLDNSNAADTAGLYNPGGMGDEVSDGIDYVPFWTTGFNSLVLAAADCQDDADPNEPGTQIVVTLSMVNLTQPDTGYSAWLEFDPNILTYRADLSTYDGPWTAHLRPIVSSGYASGKINLDANAFMSSAISIDTQLATLVFDVDQECAPTDVSFDLSASFDSELSFQGDPTSTLLVNASNIVLDDTAPLVTAPDAVALQCSADLPLPAATMADFLALTGAAASDNCDAALDLALGSSDSALVGDECNGTITRTYTLTDACGNSTSVDQVFNVADTTPPVLTPCPGNISVNADPGCSGAIVTFTPPTASDNCDAAPTVMCDANSGDLFSIGLTTVTCTATDACNNTASCSFDINVAGVNNVNATVVLPAVDATTPFSRCVKFVARDGASCATAEHVLVNFSGNPATGSAVFTVDCGNWTELCAKDEQHTLYATVTLTANATTYDADAPLSLLSGDTDNDSDVDINDVTWLLFQFGQLAADGGCAWDGTRDADFSNNGVVGSEDYNILASNWLNFSSCSCGVVLAPAPRSARNSRGAALPLAAIDATRTRMSAATLPIEVAAAADLNGDGAIDWQDVALFEQANGLPNTLSTLMQAESLDPARPAGTLGGR